MIQPSRGSESHAAIESTELRGISMDGVWRKGGEADGDVFSAVGFRRAVADPLAGRGDDGLAGLDVEGGRRGIPRGAFPGGRRVYSSNSGVCPGSTQPAGALHAGDAEGLGLGIDSTRRTLRFAWACCRPPG